MSIKVYTDGACRGNPGPGGWGVYIQLNDEEKDLYGGNPETTNLSLIHISEPTRP